MTLIYNTLSYMILSLYYYIAIIFLSFPINKYNLLILLFTVCIFVIIKTAVSSDNILYIVALE